MLRESLNKWLKIDPIEIINEILSRRAMLQWIEEKNKEQLQEGLNSQDVKLSDIGGGYSDSTLKENPEKVRDKVNLFDTGEFYKSIIAQGNSDLVEINADPIKIDELGNRTNLFNEWGKEIIGLNEENLQKLIEMVKDELIIEILKKV